MKWYFWILIIVVLGVSIYLYIRKNKTTAPIAVNNDPGFDPYVLEPRTDTIK